MAKILVIEDDLFMVRMYQRVFSYVGFEVVTATSGEEGLQIAFRDKPTLIILDIMMPRVNGLDVLKQLKSDTVTKSIPVVLLTNVADDSVMNDAFKGGAAGYIIKSQIANDDLVKEIQQYIQEWNH
jgi:CheY-like chemotaxis protein